MNTHVFYKESLAHTLSHHDLLFYFTQTTTAQANNKMFPNAAKCLPCSMPSLHTETYCATECATVSTLGIRSSAFSVGIK